MKPSRSWLLLCAVHGVVSMLLWWARPAALDALTWQADAWLQRPWTLWTSAWVHLNTPQLILNQVGLGALTAFAWMVRPPRAATVAWLLAWPLAQLSLLLWPQVGYAVGLSALLHAGALVLAVLLVGQRLPVARAQRWGALIGVGLVLELLVEQPWRQPVVWDTGTDLSVVQAAHLSGAFWGLVLGLGVWLLGRSPRATSGQFV